MGGRDREEEEQTDNDREIKIFKGKMRKEGKDK